MAYHKEPRQLVVAYRDGLDQCPQCGYWFVPTRKPSPGQRFCSQNCQIKAHEQKQKEKASTT